MSLQKVQNWWGTVCQRLDFGLSDNDLVNNPRIQKKSSKFYRYTNINRINHLPPPTPLPPLLCSIFLLFLALQFIVARDLIILPSTALYPQTLPTISNAHTFGSSYSESSHLISTSATLLVPSGLILTTLPTKKKKEIVKQK
jgi:hypothetical protein